jgi:hypothetical protein
MKLVGIGPTSAFGNTMTVPPALPPPRPDPTSPDPISDPPPYTMPHAPPYPSSGTGYPTYQLGSAPVESPVTAVPMYGTGRRTRALAVGVLATALVVLLCGVCGIAGFLLSRRTSQGGPVSAQAAASPEQTSKAASPARASKSAAPARTSKAPVAAAPTAPESGTHTVVYEVSGNTDSAFVTYAVNVNVGAAPEDIDLPWRKQVTVDSRSFLVTVLAVHIRGGPLSCRILVDGREITKNTSDNTVTCTHLVVD